MSNNPTGMGGALRGRVSLRPVLQTMTLALASTPRKVHIIPTTFSINYDTGARSGRSLVKRSLMMMSILVLALGGMTGAAVADNGEENETAALNCRHAQGSGTPISPVFLKTTFGNVNEGAVQLCKSGSYYWGYVVLYSPQISNYWATAHLFRYVNGVHNGTWSCNSSGGNGYIKPGQTWCSTPRIYGPSSNTTFMASGRDCRGSYPTCAYQHAYGVTARTR